MTDKIINPKTVGKEDVTCFYHSDMDGIASASIVKKIYPDAEFIKCDYGIVPKHEDIKDKMVIIVDFSFDPDIMVNIHKDCSLLCWIDHHQTAKNKNTEMWNSEDIDGLRDTTKAGCELTWVWFFPHEEIPKGIKLIADRDMWKFDYGDETKAFHEIVSLEFTEPNIALLVTGKVGHSIIQEWVSRGQTLLTRKGKQVRQSYNEGSDILFEGYNTRVVNSNHNVSDIGEYCYDYMKYAIAFIWSIRNGECICSLRSNCVDVGKIAEKYDGGGHASASGFKLPFHKLMALHKSK